MPQRTTAQESPRAAWDTPLLWLQQPMTSPINHSEGCPEVGLHAERVSDGTLQRVLKKLSHHHRHHPLPPDDAASPGARSGRVSQNHIQNYLNCIVPKIVQGACPHCGKVGVVGQRGNGRAATELLGTRSVLGYYSTRFPFPSFINRGEPSLPQSGCKPPFSNWGRF